MAVSRSASAKISCADLPPSSMVAGLRNSPARLATDRPTGVDPVKAILSTLGWRMSAWPATAPPVTTFRTPSGTPAAENSSAIRSADNGVSSAGLWTIVFPAASAGAILLLERISGKLNGVMAPTTPMGSRRVYASAGTEIDRVDPSIVCARAA